VSVIPIQAGPVLQGRAGLGQDLEILNLLSGKMMTGAMAKNHSNPEL
jgi:hypothetical protein